MQHIVLAVSGQESYYDSCKIDQCRPRRLTHSQSLFTPAFSRIKQNGNIVVDNELSQPGLSQRHADSNDNQYKNDDELFIVRGAVRVKAF